MAKASKKAGTVNGSTDTIDEVQSMVDVLTRKKPRTQTIPICLDTAAEEAKSAADREFGLASLAAGRDNPVDGAAERLVEATEAQAAAQAEYDENVVDFVFRAIGRHEIEEMEKECAPSAAQLKEFRDKLREQGLPANEVLRWDPDRFHPRLIAASCASPDITEATAFEMWVSPDWSAGELGVLFKAAWDVNQLV